MIEKIENLERNENWSGVLKILERFYLQERNIETAVSLIFVLWYIMIERMDNGDDLAYSILADKLSLYYKMTKTELSSDPDYLIFVGWMINLLCWDFPDANEQTGHEMMFRALEMNDNKPFYIWANSDTINLTKEEEKKAAQLALEKFDLDYRRFCLTLRTYFKSMLMTDADKGT